MQYALMDGVRSEPIKGGQGECPQCQRAVIAKCGNRVIHHWAHATRDDCDPWWENETEWHREWKGLFPVECREVSHTSETGEIHRADIKTATGIVVELQHSAISDEERISREEFYGNMIWIVDGRTFKQNFDIYHMLPDPDSELAKDLVWAKAKRHANGANHGIFFRMSENLSQYPDLKKNKGNFGWVHSIDEIRDAVEQNTRGHYQYDWVRPRKCWLETKKPVYIDFGDEFLYRLEIYDESDLPCIRLLSKKKILHDLMTEDDYTKLASRFYRIN